MRAKFIKRFLLIALVADYCSDHGKMDNSSASNHALGYLSFAAPSRQLDIVPSYPAQPYNVNANNIASLDQVKNFLYLIDPGLYASKAAVLNALIATNYDLILIDLFVNDLDRSAADISRLKTKHDGGTYLDLIDAFEYYE